jgi:conjugal transfer/entry exclusion protein
MVQLIALSLSLVCSLLALGLALHAAARIARMRKATKDLDWDDVANLTGDIASVKSTLQKLNNRINGMERVKIGTQANALNEIEQARAAREQSPNYFGAAG